MTPLILIETLAKNLRELFNGKDFATEYQGDKQLQIFEHDLPRGDFENNIFFPCVIVTLKSVEDEGDDSIATVAFTIGTYSDNLGNDYRDMFNIAEKIRQFLLTNPILDGLFYLQMPIAFEPITPEQPEPFVFGIIAVRYTIGTPRVSVSDFFNK